MKKKRLLALVLALLMMGGTLVSCANSSNPEDTLTTTDIGTETEADTVLAAIPYMQKLSELSGLPLWLTAAKQTVAAQLEGKVEPLLPMMLQKKYFDLPEQRTAPVARPLFG